MKEEQDKLADIAKTLGVGSVNGNKKFFSRKLIIASGVALVIVIALFFWKGAKSTALQYKTQEATRGNLTVTVTATGAIQPTNKVDVGSELSGVIKSVEVDYNSRVQKGQILAILDTSRLDAQVKQQQAVLEATMAKVLQANATLHETGDKLKKMQKLQELSGNKTPAQTELDAASASFERARADLASAKATESQARAALTVAETDLAKALIKSPIAGIVLIRNVEPGQTVAASFTAPVLFTLAEDLTKMDLCVNVDEADVGNIKEGQEATFTVAAYPSRVFKARIVQARYGAATNAGVVTYETVLRVDNRDLSLRPGMTATADIVVKQVNNVLLIPNSALRFTPPIKQKETPSRGLVSSLLPRPSRSRNQQGQERDVLTDKKEHNIWVWKEGKVLPITVTIGTTNGVMSEVLSGDVEAGMPLVVEAFSTGK